MSSSADLWRGSGRHDEARLVGEDDIGDRLTGDRGKQHAGGDLPHARHRHVDRGERRRGAAAATARP